MPRSSGFTLIELLVVMAILGTLATLGIVGIPAMMRHGQKTSAKTFLASLSSAIEMYRSHQGAFPPTSLRDFPGVGQTNDENSGIESAVLCLNAAQYPTPFDLLGVEGCKLENFDGDHTQAQLTRFGTNALFEAVDPWGTPYVYFNAQDYGRAGEFGKVTLKDHTTIRALPWRDSKVAISYHADTFQIISAGPDGGFNTEDDITNFVRD